MAIFVAGTKQAIRFDQFDVQDTFDPPGATFTTLPTVYRVATDPNSYDELTGSFTYNKSKDLVGGTAKTWTAVDNGETILNITGMSLSVTAASPFVNSGNSQGFLGLVFAGNDAITGSTFDDMLRGYNGNDTISGGDGLDTIEGGAGNDMLNGGAGVDSLIGGAGNDLYIVDDVGDVVVEALNGGADLVESTVDFTLGDNIESLNLSGGADVDGTGNALANIINGNQGANLLSGLDGNDKIFGADLNDTILGGVGLDSLSGGINNDSLSGEDGNDTLLGGDGEDTLDGGAGADAMTGGADDDLYVVDAATDKVVEAAVVGTDEVQSKITYTLGVNVENLTLLGDATADIDGTGNAAANSLIGNDGNNKLNGGTGADAMAGGLGDDTYIVDNAADTVTETGIGTDSVQSSVSFTLGTDVEHLTLTGTLVIDGIGNTLANKITGNAAKNSLAGDAGNDTLDGGAGADILSGGADDDLYFLDNAGDKVIESASGGLDEVRSALAIDLSQAGFEEVENGTLLGAAAVNLTGNALTNNLIGNAAANVIDGRAGDDSMAGGLGNDTYVVDSKGDQITEAAKAGIDTVSTSLLTYTLGSELEHLNMTIGGGTATGNELANKITLAGGGFLSGLDGNDTLTGGTTLDGGAGADIMTGIGSANSVYIVNEIGDRTIEAANGGTTDRVETGISWTLAAFVENLTLTGGDNVNGVGNDRNNTIIGNSGNNRLDGKGVNTGLIEHWDKLQGGDGDDTYVIYTVFDEAKDSGGNDTIETRIALDLDTGVFSGIDNLTLLGTASVSGSGNSLDNKITGNAGNNALTGDAGNDSLAGGAGNDILNGGADNDSLEGGAGNDKLDGAAGSDTLNGGAGADTMEGGDGADLFFVDSSADRFSDSGAAGTDEIRSTVSLKLGSTFALGSTIENLTLIGAAAINATGNALANILTGNIANNILDGGLGDDTMIGGKGNDTYIVNAAGDTITELLGEGIDTVKSSVNYSLATTFADRLYLTGTAQIATGNAFDNALYGNDADNSLNGLAGNDYMAGGKGDDSYFVDDAGDVVAEGAVIGRDDVRSDIADYTLTANVEDLTLGLGINGTGNASNNSITGNAADNILNGLGGADTVDGGAGLDTLDGGAGADSMSGGLGDDVYKVDNLGDQLSEAGGDGIDTVESLISFTLGADFENLTLTGTGAISGTGNAAGNVINGNSAGNMLFGLDGSDTINGGGGNDVIFGGADNDLIDAALGNDVVRYMSALDGKDIIANFDGNAAGGQDVLNLDALFDDLGVLDADRATRVQITDNGSTVDVAVDTDGDTVFDLAVATLNTADDITAGAAGTDIILGT